MRGVCWVNSRKIKRNLQTVLMAGDEGGKASVQAQSWFVLPGEQKTPKFVVLFFVTGGGGGLCQVLVVAHRIFHLHCGMWDVLVAACRIF